ncbi:MAG: hypothetical protein HY084_05755 [Gemmatimonadetes bacterium]|nr:hypothetical protein [Gemmatimonadota bacterium]
MTTPDGAIARLVAATVFILATAVVAVVWFGRRIRRSLDLGAPRTASLRGFDAVPPALVKQALERGLITSAQLATMSPVERQFVLASLRKQLEGDAPSPAPAPPPPATPPRAAAPASTPTPEKTPMTRPPQPADGALLPDKPRLKLWCPLCGEPLKLPAFPPMVAMCVCGTKTAAREDSGPGRYILNVTAPQPPRA